MYVCVVGEWSGKIKVEIDVEIYLGKKSKCARHFCSNVTVLLQAGAELCHAQVKLEVVVEVEFGVEVEACHY